jgi:hypothetical protein
MSKSQRQQMVGIVACGEKFQKAREANGAD